jgi:hypothetical protein
VIWCHDTISRSRTLTTDGPVLNNYLLMAVKASFAIHPLLCPPSHQASDCLKWNMLCSSSTSSRSLNSFNRPWSKGRAEPATFPRLSTLHVVSRMFPWVITVEAADPSSGVTCGEVIIGIDNFLHSPVGEAEFSRLSHQDKRLVTSSYYANRAIAHTLAPAELGEGLLRVDWLMEHTIFWGMTNADALGKDRHCGPAAVELFCRDRDVLTEQTARVQENTGDADVVHVS